VPGVRLAIPESFLRNPRDAGKISA